MNARRGLALAGFLLGLSASLVAARKRHAPDRDRPDLLLRVPEAATVRANPLEDDSDAAKAGNKLYQRHCTECHGLAGAGSEDGPSLRTREVQDAPSGTLFWVLTNGSVRSGMPVWSKLPETQRWQIVAYVRTLGASEPSARR
jgi:mono/diheme cytochrome c family protein